MSTHDDVTVLLQKHEWELPIALTRQPDRHVCDACEFGNPHAAVGRVCWRCETEPTEPVPFRELDCPFCIDGLIPLLECIEDMEGEVDGYIEVWT